MSTFTVTIGVTGNVKGQAVNYTTSFDVEDVYDARNARVGAGSLSGIGHGTDGYVGAVQDCPSLIYARNTNPSQAGAVYLNDAITGDTKIIGLSPGQFVLLHEAINGEGIIASNATATATMEPVSGVTVQPFPNFHGYVEGSILTLNIAST